MLLGADMKSKGLALTSSGNLKCKYVLHIVAPKSEIGWFQIIKKIIDLAVANGFASLSFPALGTGISYLLCIWFRIPCTFRN